VNFIQIPKLIQVLNQRDGETYFQIGGL